MTSDPSPALLPFPPVILGFAGCSGSGKTTLAIELARELSGLHFPLDHYYRDLSHLPPSQRPLQNFDDPAMIESPLLAAHIAALARGESIQRPLYDFSTHSRVPGRTETVSPGALVLVEGIFALAYPESCPTITYAFTWKRPTRSALSADSSAMSPTAAAPRSPSAASTKPRFAPPAFSGSAQPKPTPTW